MPAHDDDLETSSDVLRDLALGGAFLGGPRMTAYDARARFEADLRYGRNRDRTVHGGSAPAPVRVRGPQLPPARRRVAAAAPPLARRPVRRPSAQEPDPELGAGYWFLRKPTPSLPTLEERLADRRARQDAAQRETFLRAYRARHPSAPDGEALTAWEIEERFSRLDLGG